MAAAGIYKPGQGYWTRTMSAVGAGLLLLMGALWLWDLLKTVEIGKLPPIYVSMIGVLIICAIFGWLGYYLIGLKPRVVDFMIATEGELKKVNWSTRREILGSTWVVIGLTILIAALCWIFDFGFAFVFKQIGVLQAG
jgi:preprotein translocase SecE subunit